MMKRWGLHRIRDSFSARLRVYVVGFTALLFVVAFYVFFRFSYGFIRDEAVHRAEALLDNTILRIDGVLDAVETAAGNSAWEVETHLDEPIFSATRDMKDTSVMSIGRRMVAGKQGMEVLQNDDTLSYVFYAPIKTGWSVATVCPREEVFASLDKIQLRVVAIVCAGLVLLALVCARIIRHVVTPLSRFAGAARQIAGGDFNVPLPQSKYKDEMGQLHDAFEYMQKALVEYMDRLRRTTAHKERIESELRIASDIQMGMIPKLFPPFPERKDIDLFAVLKPAKEVGGDLYDFFIH